MSDFRNLKVWQKAHALSGVVLKEVELRKAPAYTELRRQMIRSTLSIESNIAEGSGKGSDKDFVRFLRISVGSCNELEGQLLTAGNVEYLPSVLAEKLLEDVTEIRKMLNGLIKYLERSK